MDPLFRATLPISREHGVDQPLLELVQHTQPF